MIRPLTLERARGAAASGARARLLAGIPVAERRLPLAGIPTAVLEGGHGPPMILLHGPGEFAAKWWRVLPDLTARHRVIAPDLPGHGASEGADERLDAERVRAWLDALIERTCPSPPIVVGHVLGGAIAARFAVSHPGRLGRLVLVDSLGLAPFRPSPRFALSMVHFMVRPSEQSYDRFMRQCSHDVDALREGMGARWEPFVAYTLDRARSPSTSAVRRLMREVGLPAIPAEALERIDTPTFLVWGRHDRANRLAIAEAASARFGWPLHVIDDCADDPARDRPGAFLRVLEAIVRTAPDREAAA